MLASKAELAYQFATAWAFTSLEALGDIFLDVILLFSKEVFQAVFLYTEFSDLIVNFPQSRSQLSLLISLIPDEVAFVLVKNDSKFGIPRKINFLADWSKRSKIFFLIDIFHLF